MSADTRFESLKAIVPAVSRETVDRLIAFEELFRKWSKAINLASPSTLNELWTRHILDSAQLFPLASDAKKWLDIGSGGGFPGIVTACFLADQPGSAIDLIESAGKKAAFLRTVAGHLNIPSRIHSARIEAMWQKIETPQVVTARALASLSDLFGLAEPWLTNGAKALFQKGRDYQREIDESRVGWSFDLVQHQSAIDQASVILEISNLRRKTD
ncbi:MULTISPECIES: 16S rRNA (guanine(527)-N(7))-methyltransferase RsmG [Brucella/Ochrobactrum group]|jgi:16S rRNA (guanine527-N7)-methyltransferase|uniref:Ribosomal RNA small subunit methyltransferase G n=1 Tax=Brucella pseudintermedia TaxID=370111 RepID=A0ABY5U8E3_9HYPH|nr:MULTISPECIES: 16S rRNA (guanine(527)-N(7))-methyltransferase RsmG [Brucella/Ochrobactrum group]KAB2681638.1 16S rRNA (guanine(527)-N(7))-methyltransferase RsmG [Brucella pseudintermedia]MCO7726996.1 16S rRNA (guanine(527)-N(7))-methyltransferase RsmG [Brucella intermedia]NKE76299.1 16S rRNA (guanine(527)-N(7))-methyltransferase RsmG [Ochrobactrum sp. MC-1LL]TWG96082.1 16S rRNA m(7)G-527 methyltransferase [Ochrobactrum sp. J50]UWL59591.1 16S rRNA (guanine(527)-N(7))-methyltransferase RsmG [B